MRVLQCLCLDAVPRQLIGALPVACFPRGSPARTEHTLENLADGVYRFLNFYNQTIRGKSVEDVLISGERNCTENVVRLARAKRNSVGKK
jgi:hypothetical protein